MENIEKLYLLGAGASYGHKEDLPNDEQPPMGDYLFEDGWRSGILQREDFSHLLEKLIKYLDDRGDIVDIKPRDLEYNAERFLQDIQEEFEKRSNHEAQTALSLAYYYFYEVFRRYTNSFSPKGSNYTKLAKEFDNTKFGVINLNYDCLFEKSIEFVGSQYHYLPSYQQEGSIPIAKIHGSVNLVSDFESGISIRTDDFIEKVKHVHSNRVWTDTQRLNFKQLNRLDYRDLVFNAGPHLEPAIIPPIGGGKDYQKLELYQEFQSFAANMLSEVEELVIIGSSLTIHDDQLLKLLSQNLRDNIKITVVCGSQSNGVKSRLNRRLVDPEFNLEYERFGDYVEGEL